MCAGPWDLFNENELFIHTYRSEEIGNMMMSA